MPWSKKYRELYDFAFKDDSDFNDFVPKEGESNVGTYIGQLWEDAKKYLENSFSANKDFNRFGYSSPEEFWQACSRLEGGDHYSVYPTRKSGTGNSWKQEQVDNEIQKQIRAKKNHITSSWHEITISPNIIGIDQIFDQERKKTEWSENVREWVSYAQNFGDIYIRSILDKATDPQGLATEITCKPGSVLITPEAKSIKKIDGCWYLIHGQRVNDNWVKKNYPKIDLSSGGSTPSFFRIDKKVQEYTHTKMFNMLEIFCDDDSYEEIPFDQEDFDQRIGLLMDVVQNPSEDPRQQEQDLQVLTAQKDDNHKKFIKAYSDWTDEKLEFYQGLERRGELISDDIPLINTIVQVVDNQIRAHQQLMDEEKAKTGIPAGKQKKYPFGRYVVTINGVLAEDKKNPYNNPWRKMFRKLYNEKVPERVDGRGDVEILWQDNKILDTMLSRFADDALMATFKKPWFKPEDKKYVEEGGYSTDPTIPGYANNVPQFASGQANTQYLNSYNIVKQGIKESLGVNQVTRGDSSFSGESGAHAEALISQNVTMVAGELNLNLNDVIEDIVECRFLLWREFYTEPRPYIIDGQQVMLVLAEYLRQMPVEENGQMGFKDVGAIEVSVKPESNFPNKDNLELRMLTEFAKLTNEDGLPLIPSTMILDYLSKRFTGLATGSKYRRDLQLLAIGKQAIEEDQQQQELEKKQREPMEAVAREVQNKITTEAANEILENNGVTNGTTSRK